MSKIILFSNIKGGVGKTTLCAQFAEFLAMKGVSVVAIDADLQASLSRHRDRELEADPEQTVPWAIAPLNTLDSTRVKEAMNEYKEQDGIVLIDCPGNLNDNNLAIIYAVADLVVIPMTYDVDTIDATGIFVAVIKQQSKARLVFVPNRINVTEGKAREREMRNETISVLGQVGTVTPRIKQSVVIKRYSTLYPLNKYQYAAVEYAFDRIIEIINQL
jgi:chromosome partitioning protein